MNWANKMFSSHFFELLPHKKISATLQHLKTQHLYGIKCMKLKSIAIMTLPMTIMLSACGGGSDSAAPAPSPTPAPTPPPSPAPTPTPTVGSLSTSVTGLPANASPSFSVTGPDNFSASWDGVSPLTSLPYGDYQLTVNEIVTAQGIFDAIPASLTVTVDGDESVDVLYQTELVSNGVITGFGSVVVNGVRFNTDDASFDSHNGQLSENALDLGMVVNVVGRTTADGSVVNAQSVSYFATAEGPVADISFGQGTFSVLGQTFNVDANTRFVDRRFEQLRIGDLVEVSAVGDNQLWTATRVEFYTQLQDDYDVTGFVSALDTSAQTFTLGGLTIDYSRADVDGTLSDGALVNVEAPVLPQGTTWQVLDVDVLRNEAPESRGQLVLEGLIESITEDQLTLTNGSVVTMNADTSVVNARLSDLAVGNRVVIRATRTDDGLVANQVRVVLENLIQASGTVTERDNNEIRVNGTEFDVNDATSIVDTRVSPPLQITLADIVVGDQVEVSGFYDEDNDLTASDIRLLDASVAPSQNRGGVLDIEGRLSAFTTPDSNGSATLTINGLDITTQSVTRFYFNDRFVNADEFFSRVQVNDTIDIDARIVDGAVLAYEVEREDELDNRRGSFEIEGNVSEGLNDGRFVLSGLTVLITANTRFEDGNESALIAGAYVEVKATEDSEGNIVAIVVDFEDANDRNDDDSDVGEVEVEGRINNLTTQGTFTIGNQAIALLSDTEFENGSRNSLRDGLWVEVDGYLDRDGVLQADHVYIEEDREDDVEGTISQIIDADQFVVNGITVVMNNRTEFEDGRRSDITVGRRVEVEGQFTAADRILAFEVYFKD